MNHPVSLVLGVDGGGTKTAAFACDAEASDLPVRGRGFSGPANRNAVGTETALQNLDAAARAALNDAGHSGTAVKAVCLGCAGADRPADRDLLLEWMSQRWPSAAGVVVNDAELILAAGSARRTGIALIAGTGSLAWGRDPSGATARSGGWGYLIDDTGSAFAVGQAALRAVAATADKRAPDTGLTELVMKHFGLSHISQLVPVIYQSEDPRLTIAAAASLVVRAADTGDQTAHQIVRDAIAGLSALVHSVLQQLDFSEPPEVAIGGGMLVHYPRYCDWFQDALLAADPPFARVRLVAEPAIGAVRLAAEAIGRPLAAG